MAVVTRRDVAAAAEKGIKPSPAATATIVVENSKETWPKYTVEVDANTLQRWRYRGPSGDVAFKQWFEARLKDIIVSEVY